MWSREGVDVEVLYARHPNSKSNVTKVDHGELSPLSDMGLLQMPVMKEYVQYLNIDCVTSSQTDRTVLALLDVAAEYRIPGKPFERIFNEIRRPQSTVGRSKEILEVRAARRRQILEFGPGYQVQDGEESFEEATEIIQAELDYFLWLHREEGYKRILHFGHGLRARQVYAYIMSGGDPELFAAFFKATYRRGGFENLAFMHIWYGFPYEDLTGKCWNVELGFALHIPKTLRST